MPWDYPKAEYEKQKQTDPIWHLERLINYGLAEEKLDKNLLEKHLKQLRIPENRRLFLELLLWNRQF